MGVKKNKMENADLLYKLIQTVLFILPLAGLIWKAARQAGRIEEMERGLTELTAKMAKIENQNKADILEIKNSINSLNIAFIKIDTALQFITKEIKKGKE